MQLLQNASQKKALVLTLPFPFNRRRFHLAAWVAGILCLIVLGATLTAGLVPFHVPQNGVTWVQGENVVRFRGRGTMLGSFPLTLDSNNGISVELWIQPSEVWTKGCILALLNRQRHRQFVIEQSDTDLVVRVEDLEDHAYRPALRVKNLFRKPQAFITITSDAQTTAIYVDGQLQLRSPALPLSGEDLSGEMILGNGPFRDHSWSGEIKGLALYERELKAQQVAQDYASWTQHGHPVSDGSEPARALYVFQERSGDVVHSAVSSGPDLVAPHRFKVVDQLLFESPASEFRSQPGYLNSAVWNVAGFVPLGFALTLYWSMVWDIRRTWPIVVGMGTAVSLTIEYFQSFLPTRFSGVTDLFTNTAGTFIGVMLCRWIVLRHSKPAKQAATRFAQ